MNKTNRIPSGDSPLSGYSIVIPVYNGAKTLPDTLRSVTGLDHPAYEIIVVDDGSQDESAHIVQTSGAKVIRLEANQGPANARNQGAKHALYDKILFTDSDVLVPKGLLKKLDERFLESQADAVQGTFSEVCPFANYFSQYKNLYNRFVLNRLPVWIDTTFTSVTAVKRDAFLTCGGFDAHIRGASVEDRTLGRNLIQHGFRICLDRSLEVIHNKKLTLGGFLRNQFKRSRDLAKLLLRNHFEEKSPQIPLVSSFDDSGRFGTNSLSTMIRIPIAYCTLGLACLAILAPSVGLYAIFFLILFLGFIQSFEWELLRRRGLTFALLGIPANFMDALASGMGIGWGIIDYFVLQKKY